MWNLKQHVGLKTHLFSQKKHEICFDTNFEHLSVLLKPIKILLADICVSMEEDENNEWLHKGSLDQHNEAEHLVENTPGLSHSRLFSPQQTELYTYFLE
jgi:hypothetical protein